ncbi:MAG: hypothetical protein K8R53_08500, partial [Bacteroidales bacterium]|nr:hypothetical protein [Bacteroidales bacterium]
TGSVWPLYTGWVALAEYKYGNHLQGFTHVKNNLNVYRQWSKGFIEEVLNGANYKPGGVCAHQCWSETMAIQPLIEGMLGIKPDAINKILEISPAVPADWDFYEVKNISIGQKLVNFKMKRKKNVLLYEYTSSNDDKIEIRFDPVLPKGTIIKKIIVNEERYEGFPVTFTLQKKARIELDYSGGISVLPYVPDPQPGDKAGGLRIISDRLDVGLYEIILEAPAGFSGDIRLFSKWDILKAENAILNKLTSELYQLTLNFEENEGYISKKVALQLKKQ